MTLIRGGVFTRADARACGYPDPDIDSLLETGSWRRIRPGTYAPHQVLTVVDERMVHLRRIYRLLRYGEAGLTASHQSAAALHGLPTWGLDLGQVHVTARDGRPGRHAGGVHRHVRDPVGPQVLTWNKLRMASPARAVAEVAAAADRAPAVALAEAALYAGLVTPAGLRRATSQLVRGFHRAHRVIELAGMGSASVAESRLRLILSEAGLPTPLSCPPPVDFPPADGSVPDASLTDGSHYGGPHHGGSHHGGSHYGGSHYDGPHYGGSEVGGSDVGGLQVGGGWETSALWFPDERTVIEFEARFPFPSYVSDDDTEELPDHAISAHDPSDYESYPEPLEYCWISWADLDNPTEVVDRIHSSFTRATRRTGIRLFDPTRRRKSGVHRHWPGRLITPTQEDLPS
ncbi:type IV toxin-antitoxin system AbiEi family antitoxin domain-containing protein [Kribbella monticola]|uniref:type IV toxin-antitoxin system AbiEi family antitoxin domain-containing protein n=1 Tax=Kribbella monticola TaxID=2185285 RepID=UPI001E469E7E|nr:type IV toxin-antitoxin system AbiEi family antitoxin domain-containing protein [Kribbella monticola]